jgi:hypothetical protein
MPFNIGGYIFNSSMASNQFANQIITKGLLLYLDAGNINSYPGSGTTWTDLSGLDNNGTINGVSWVSDGLKSYFNFPTVSDSNYISTAASQTYLDFTFVFQPDFTASGLVGLIGSSAPGTAADKSLRFEANGTTPWTITPRNPGDLNDWAYSTATTYYVNGAVSNTLVSGWNIFGGYKTNQTTFPASFTAFLGSSAYPSRGFKGKLAVALMYNRQLTAAEQLYNYNALKSRFGL